MMGRDNLNKAESEVLDLSNEVKRLNREKSNLIIETNKLADNLSKMKDEQIALEKKAIEIIESANIKAQQIRDDAASLYEKVKEKEKDLNNQIGEVGKRESSANATQKQAQDLLKSNEGLNKSLSIQNEEARNKILTLGELVKTIKEVIERLS